VDRGGRGQREEVSDLLTHGMTRSVVCGVFAQVVSQSQSLWEQVRGRAISRCTAQGYGPQSWIQETGRAQEAWLYR
jgi:hypothetical protein